MIGGGGGGKEGGERDEVFVRGGGGGGARGAIHLPESGFAPCPPPPEMGYDHLNTGQSPYKTSPPQF